MALQDLDQHLHHPVPARRSVLLKRSGGEEVEDWQLAAAASHDEKGLVSAEAEALDNIPSSQLRTALESLSEDQRVVVLLSDVEGFAYKEIADMLDIPIGLSCLGFIGDARIYAKACQH